MKMFTATRRYQGPVIAIAVIADPEFASCPLLQAMGNQRMVSFRQLT